jgi:hypothetical protein
LPILGPSVGGTVASASTTAGHILATPQKICRSISKAVGKKLAESNFSVSFFDKDDQSASSTLSKNRKKSAKKESASPTVHDPYFTNVGPKFDMIASATLTLDDCSEGMFLNIILNSSTCGNSINELDQ